MFHCRYVTIFAICWINTLVADVIREEDICGPHNGRRLYLELGDQGILHAYNVSLVKNLPRQDSTRPYTTNSSHDQCSLELVTCPSCIITVTFKSINLLHHCGDGGMTIDSPCRCDYVWVSEPPYEDVSGTPFCGHYAPITYRSNTRTLSIALLYSQSHKHAFTLDYTAERNRLIMKGSTAVNEMSKSMNNTGGGILTSPFFPSRYPRDLGMEYIITCPTEAPTCRVRVLFSDFQLAPVSIMEFYDWNGQRLDVSSGARFRPPIIVSSGPSLLIRFYANGGTGLGYKAFYSFVLMDLYDKHVHPITDCGGYVENLGGTITMMDMVGEGIKTYDCVWLIRPPKNFLHMRTHMYLKVITFAEMASNTELIIKQGPTSALMPLEVLRHPVSQLQPPRLREHITPVTSGFHVSLRGSFGPNSRLAIAYAAFSYMDCFTGADFLCQNHRCISSQLNCDGFDHCGDNSDEPATCLHDWDVSMPERKWQQSKANYYFPKIDRYPDLKTATLVFVASSLGLIVLISALIVLLYRVGARARQQRELQSRLRTISELLDGARIDEITVSDDPPVYEAPPNYDEVIKLGMEDETGNARRKKRRSPRNGDRRSRSMTSSQCSYDLQSKECDNEATMTLNIHENPSSANRSSQIIPLPSNTSENSHPESPPPPYVTPPGTIPRQYNYSLVSDLPGPSREPPSLPILPQSNENPTTSASLESADSITAAMSRVRLCRGECREAQNRRTWLRNSTSFSRSLPTSRATSGERSSSSNDETTVVSGDVVSGAVLVNNDNKPAIEATTSCPAQSVKLNDASTNTKIESVVRCVSVADEEEELLQVEQHLHRPTLVAAVALPEEFDDVEEDVHEHTERIPIVGCSCEGACGCANVPETSKALVLQRSSTEDSPSARSRIIKLLGGSNRMNLDSGPSSLSSPCSGSFLTRNPSSICSRSTKISSLSQFGSYEKLQDEFDVVSETTSILGPGTLANTPRRTPNKFAMPISKHYSTCDLDSLYESIRVLDTFLARRESDQSTTTTSTRITRPMTVMLFGTPKHRNNNGSTTSTMTISSRGDSTETAARIRLWKSIDDTNAS